MNFSIKKFNGIKTISQPGEIVFYVQCVGNNSGRPLKKAIPNSWEFRTSRQADWEILNLVFFSKILHPFLIGSVIPYIRLEDYKNIITPILENSIHESGEINAKYLQIQKIEQQITHFNKITNLLKEMKTATAQETIRQLKKMEVF